MACYEVEVAGPISEELAGLLARVGWDVDDVFAGRTMLRERPDAELEVFRVLDLLKQAETELVGLQRIED